MESYLALVLSGGYEEAGGRGLYRVKAGDEMMHGGFEAHLNRYAATGSGVLNLPLPAWVEPQARRESRIAMKGRELQCRSPSRMISRWFRRG